VTRPSGVVRLVRAATIVVVLVFAVQGGEYSTLDLVHLRRERGQMLTSIDSLTRVVDSLRKYYDRLQHDPKLQERIAREDFGMVRGTKEVLYRFAEPSDIGADSTKAKRR
jgi:cell division protein FtsB